MSNRKVRLIKKIIYDTEPEELTDEAKELLWLWFTDPGGDREAEKLFEKLFVEEMGRMGRPSEKARSMHKILRERLGLDEVKGRVAPEPLQEQKEFAGVGTPARKTPLPRKPGQRIAVAAVAAAVTVALVVSGLRFFSGDTIVQAGPDIASETQAPEISVPVYRVLTVSTLAGEQKHLLMSDGSEIWLNENSSLRYPEDFTGERIVELDGEAYFSVQRSDGATFRVKADKLTVTVRGTMFNVQAYAGTPQAEVRLDAGEIEVAAGRETRVVRPNNKIVLEKQTDRVQAQEVPEEGKEPWRSDMEFVNISLHDVLVSTAGYFNMTLDVTGELPDDYITFGFSYEASPEYVLSTLKYTHKYFSYEISDGVIRIKTD